MSAATYNFGDYTACLKICQGILTFPLLPCAPPPSPTTDKQHVSLRPYRTKLCNKKTTTTTTKTKSTYKSQLAHHCQSLSQFLQHEAARSISNPAGRDVNPTQVPFPQFVRFPQQFASTHSYSWLEKGTLRVKCLAQEHNTVSHI